MSSLRFDQLGKDFGASTALTGLDLEVSSGESVVLLGPSGCGKTTTLRMVAGFERPTRGSVAIGDAEVAGPRAFVPPEAREVGVVFQSYALWPHLTVADNVAFGLTVRRRRKHDRHSRGQVADQVERALAQVQLGGYGERYPHQLSGGQQQRVALARALVTQPKVLLLDEPLSNLDSVLREEMRLEIRRIQRESGVTMLYITHDRAEALALADRVVALNRGRVEQIGAPDELFRTPATRFVAQALGPANFVPAHVVSDGGAARLATGQVVELAVACIDRAGTPVTVCVRPGDISLRPEPAAAAPGARVGEAVFLGDEVHYDIEVTGLATPVRVVDHAAQPLPVGTPVALQVAERRASVLADPPGPNPHAVPLVERSSGQLVS